jgi:hypothetical protein
MWRRSPKMKILRTRHKAGTRAAPVSAPDHGPNGEHVHAAEGVGIDSLGADCYEGTGAVFAPSRLPKNVCNA